MRAAQRPAWYYTEIRIRPRSPEGTIKGYWSRFAALLTSKNPFAALKSTPVVAEVLTMSRKQASKRHRERRAGGSLGPREGASLDRLTRAVAARSRADVAAVSAVAAARAEGHTWERIGQAAGITKQGAAQRWGRRG